MITSHRDTAGSVEAVRWLAKPARVFLFSGELSAGPRTQAAVEPKTQAHRSASKR